MTIERVYFDNAATTPLDKEVIAAMLDVMQNTNGNPSSTHADGRKARTIIEKARKTVASILEVAPGEIFFTSCGTEADNMVAKCLVRDHGVTDIITSQIEHHAILHTVEECAKYHNTNMHYVRITENGYVDLEHFKELLAACPKGNTLVTLMHANNEIGNLIDLSFVGNLCKEHGAFFHSDTVQTIAHLPIKPKELGLHFLSASAHKFNGPKGIGFIFISNEIKIHPFISGGSQERNMRGGTENIYGIIGLAKAMEIACGKMEEYQNHIQGLKDYMIEKLEQNIPGVLFNGDPKGDSLYTVLNVAIPPNSSAEMLLFNLDIEGVSASGGSACTSGSDVGSHVLAQLPIRVGYTPIRFSFGKQNTKEEVDFTIAKLKKILQLEMVEQKNLS